MTKSWESTPSTHKMHVHQLLPSVTSTCLKEIQACTMKALSLGGGNDFYSDLIGNTWKFLVIIVIVFQNSHTIKKAKTGETRWYWNARALTCCDRVWTSTWVTTLASATVLPWSVLFKEDVSSVEPVAVPSIFLENASPHLISYPGGVVLRSQLGTHWTSVFVVLVVSPKVEDVCRGSCACNFVHCTL